MKSFIDFDVRAGFMGLVNHLGDTSKKEKVPGRNNARSVSSKIFCY